MTEREGTFSVPTRLLLTAAQRAKLEQLVREERRDLSDVVSQIIADYLEPLPTPEIAAPAVPNRSLVDRKKVAELARLRARRDAAGASAPPWLNSYIAELEAELRRGER